MTTNADRLKRYKEKMKQAGFRRLCIYASADLVELIDREHQQGECMGRTLERLLLGEAKPRPDYWTAAERAQKAARRAASGRQITKA